MKRIFHPHNFSPIEIPYSSGHAVAQALLKAGTHAIWLRSAIMVLTVLIVGAPLGKAIAGSAEAPLPATWLGTPTGNVAKNYQHWADVVPPNWQGDILNDGKSDYFEGEVIPHAYIIQASNSQPLVQGQTYTFNIVYNYYQANTNAGGFDDMATYNFSRSPGLLPNATGIAPIPDAATGFAGTFHSVDADVLSVTAPITLGTGTKDRSVTVTWRYTGTTTSSGIAEIYFGLRIAEPGAVPNQGSGTTKGASAWSGGSLQTTIDNTVFSGALSIQLAPSAIIVGSISGTKYSDLNNNGIRNVGEPVLSGWVFYLDNNNNGIQDAGEETATTDASGNFSFSVTPDANKSTSANDPYYVREVNQSGWTQTQPSSGGYGPILITAADPTETGLLFGNYQCVSPAPMTSPTTVCEAGASGGASVDLASLVTNNGGGTLSYYATQAHATSGTSPLGSSTVSAPIGITTYWVRSTSSASNDCYGVVSVAVTVTDNPDLVTSPTTVCENGSTGAASVNLASLVTDADGGALSYYATQADATAAANPLASSTVSAPIGTKTYWVRSATGSCYGVASVAVTVTDNPDVTATSTTVCETGSTGAASVSLASLVTDADGGTLSYYASQAHANAGTSPLASSTVSAPIGTTTYWVRSATGDCYGIASVAVTVTDNPDVITSPTTVCETGNSGAASVNLASLVTDADGGTLSYYATQADATAASNALVSSTVSAPIGTTTYWVRSATSGGCYGIASMAVTVTDNPDLVTSPTTVCENGATGAASVNLASLVTDADGGTLSYYATQAHANAGTNALASSTVSAPNGTTTTYWVRSTTSGGCYGVASVAVTVTDNPDLSTSSATVCETGSTGEASVDLASLVTNADGGTLSYYASQAHANAGTSPLTSSTVSAPIGTTTYWVRSATGSCFGVASMAVTVTDNPDVITSPTTVCESGSTGHASVNLSSLVTNADGGTLSYYTNQADAMNATSPLASSTVSAPNGATTYWVRSTKSGGCYGVASIVVTVTDNPDVTTAATTVCEDINNNTPRTGGASVNLASLVTEADGGTLSYYTSQANAMAASNALASSTVFAPLGITTYWVRSATNGGCYGVASVAVTVKVCSGITLEKRTNGLVDNTKTYTFAIYSGSMRNTKPGSATALHTQSTTLANSTTLFDGVLLSANQKYSLCELGIPSGYSVIWEVVNADGTVTSVSTLYDPDVTSGGGDYNQGEAVGNLCTEFGAGTALELPTNEDGQTVVRLRFRVNNTFPLGTARTPGYWKNWNMCTGGKQAQTAVKNGGKAAGFYILEDHLPMTLWTNTTTGLVCGSSSNFTLTSCGPAVKLLNTQDASGKQKASDAAYNLAKHLLAYKLNIASKAAPCASAAAAATNAEALLSGICFNGSGDYLPSNTKQAAQRALALSYAKTLDAFNNNLPCGSPVSSTAAATIGASQSETELTSLTTSVYPNPTHSDATVTFSAPKAGHAVVVVYNALGAKVATLYDGQVEAGQVKHLALKGADFATGAYFYRVTVDDMSKTHRFNIIK